MMKGGLQMVEFLQQSSEVLSVPHETAPWVLAWPWHLMIMAKLNESTGDFIQSVGFQDARTQLPIELRKAIWKPISAKDRRIVSITSLDQPSSAGSSTRWRKMDINTKRGRNQRVDEIMVGFISKVKRQSWTCQARMKLMVNSDAVTQPNCF